ncbi:UDP-N-acetylglucosamine 1-carboxyvinyltransferase [Anaerocolumna sedimenticola]|uniref:UDP-N-acetylglucosamine 1-carboxyvinyltransferase n=1 Tax=Anaerocolumna sedimenticola TaxID=2696063 RepID=A0A6P1TRA0_9FIRM|nr:UDP-N-acetylglucosamine 1-carboxyvinyltransferase [Anaerocolumna sedimenticola]QHQ62055.1 UDP-N-acetylglucosamine 1-carboxyvinyltransferase [Anaerocolumna sedimenticola]
MAFIEIIGGKQLNGEVNIQGSKNAVLPILAATVLINGIVKLNNCPKILDVFHMIKILEAIGCNIWWEKSSLIIDTTKLNTSTVPEDYVKMMRSSIILMGALLGRTHSVTITYPGGCTIGARPIDYHLSAFQDMNVSLEEEDGLIKCTTTGIKGNDIFLKFPSVGATENVILTAVLASGKTSIINAAKEPEITELCKFLNAAGAKITGVGTETIEIIGVDFLRPTEYTACSDRIVAGTYLAAVAGTGGEAVLTGIGKDSLNTVIKLLREMGCSILTGEDYIIIASSGRPKPIPFIRTMPYPGFPTDMQSQIMSVLMMATGTSKIVEEIFEGRYQNVKEQIKFGADIRISGREATIYGVPTLYGCEVFASELRGGAALVIAGLMAKGKTTIYNPYFIERGYEDICRDLRGLGADIKMIT